MDDAHLALSDRGYAQIAHFASPAEAFDAAKSLVHRDREALGMEALEVIGDFILPPPDGLETRDFQTLHFDFGLPLHPKVEHDVARYTALFIPPTAEPVTAATRLVPIETLLSQRAWPEREELIHRLVAYGQTHGAWDDADGYVEGSLARLVEAAAGLSPLLPSVKAELEFLCGTEFDGLQAELAFFTRHGLDILAVESEVVLRPGELLVFDNLTFAHGRRGIRRPGELHQRVFGHKGLSPNAQRALRNHVLSAFGSPQLEERGPLAPMSRP